MNTPDLSALYEEFNNEYFGGILPKIDLEWNSRYRTRGGSCYYKRDSFGRIVPSKIALNTNLLIDNPEGLRETLIHEMVHAWRTHITGLRCGHDSQFQSKMNSIFGYKKSHRTHNMDTSNLREKAMIEYHCPNHGVIGKRARMPSEYNLERYRCNLCGNKIAFVDTRLTESVQNKSNGKISIKVRMVAGR